MSAEILITDYTEMEQLQKKKSTNYTNCTKDKRRMNLTRITRRRIRLHGTENTESNLSKKQTEKKRQTMDPPITRARNGERILHGLHGEGSDNTGQKTQKAIYRRSKQKRNGKGWIITRIAGMEANSKDTAKAASTKRDRDAEKG